MPTEWITAAELETHLGSIGVTVPSGTDLESEISAAVEVLDEMCGGLFLEGTEAEFTYLQPRSHVLFLKRYFTAVSEVKYQDSADIIPAEAYKVVPLAGPFTRIEFGSRMAGLDDLVVTGTPGYSATIPNRLWNAVRDLASANVLGLSAAGSAIEVEQGELRVKFGSGSGSTSRTASMKAGAMATFERYRLPWIASSVRQ